MTVFSFGVERRLEHGVLVLHPGQRLGDIFL
jgi:hypothetical protein